MAEDIFQGRGAPLTFYGKRDEDWPAAWLLPELDEDEADLFGNMAHLSDDLILRTAVNIWDNCIRAPGAFEGVVGGVLSAHARLVVGSGRCEDLARAADAVRDAWLGMAEQAAKLGVEGNG
jgi:hypothetical protein